MAKKEQTFKKYSKATKEEITDITYLSFENKRLFLSAPSCSNCVVRNVCNTCL